MLYHGSSIGGLKELRPNISEHGKPYVYLTSNPVVALLYTVKVVEPPYNWFPYGFRDGIPVYTEYYPDALADIYKGKAGFIYEFEDVEGAENPTDINCACVCTELIKTEKVTEIRDVYEYLLENEKKGELIIERYEELSDKKKQWIENIIKSEIAEYDLKNNADNSYARFIANRFPDIWK